MGLMLVSGFTLLKAVWPVWHVTASSSGVFSCGFLSIALSFPGGAEHASVFWSWAANVYAGFTDGI